MKKIKRILRLIQNELFKGFLQKKTIVFIIFLMLCIFMCVAICSPEDSGDWRKSTKEQIVNLEDEIQKTEKTLKDDSLDKDEREFYESLLIMQKEQSDVLEFRLEKDIPENVVTPLKFVYKCKELFFLIALFIIVFSANIIANEYNWGTIRQLFIKPVNRTELFFVKYISTVIATIILSTLFFVATILLGYVFFGGNSTSIYEVVVNNGNIKMENMLVSTIQTTAINIFIIFVLSAVSICIASILRNNTLAIIISLGTWWIGIFIGESLKNNVFYKYFLTPNLSLEGYLSEGAVPYSGGTMEKSIVICMVYLIVLLIVGRYFFAKKDVY